MYVSENAEKRVLEYIRNAAEGAAIAEISHNLQLSPSCVYGALTRLIGKRAVARRKDKKINGACSTFFYYPVEVR